MSYWSLISFSIFNFFIDSCYLINYLFAPLIIYYISQSCGICGPGSHINWMVFCVCSFLRISIHNTISSKQMMNVHASTYRAYLFIHWCIYLCIRFLIFYLLSFIFFFFFVTGDAVSESEGKCWNGCDLRYLENLIILAWIMLFWIELYWIELNSVESSPVWCNVIHSDLFHSCLIWSDLIGFYFILFHN